MVELWERIAEVFREEVGVERAAEMISALHCAWERLDFDAGRDEFRRDAWEVMALAAMAAGLLNANRYFQGTPGSTDVAEEPIAMRLIRGGRDA